jgi:glycerol-3-phosphate acyltransferase PlsX
VLVTDGFTGNVTLKVAEGFSEAMMRSVMKEASADADLAAKLKPLIAQVMKRYDHEEAGGAMLLGVQGMFFKVHGSTGARGIKNTVATVKSLSKLNVSTQIESHLAPKTA